MQNVAVPPTHFAPPTHNFTPKEWNISEPDQRVYVGDFIVIQGYTVCITKVGMETGQLIAVPSMDRYSDATFDLQYEPDVPKPDEFLSDFERSQPVGLDLTRGRFFITETDLTNFLKWTNGHATPWRRWGGSV